MKRTGDSGGCTDTGDVSHIMPVLHPYMTGARGPATAPTTRSPIRSSPHVAIDLLADGGTGAGEVLSPSRPRMTPRTSSARGSGFWGGQRPSLAPYVTGMGPTDGAAAARGG